MNRDSITFNLKEALEELTGILDAINLNPEYQEDDFRVSMEHLYHHVNFAWNTRHASSDDIDMLSDASFYAWRVFPQDIDLSDQFEDTRQSALAEDGNTSPHK
jgi:hypothetical protein